MKFRIKSLPVNLEIFLRFLFLGCCSFGGPAAHLGYFYKTFVERLKWINESGYTHLLGLSQFLPGPGSSQVGFAIGLQRNGLFGGISAFVGFTLPSFIIMFFMAGISTNPHILDKYSGYIHGLKILAFVVVADACWSMYQKFCQDKLTKIIALLSACALLFLSGLFTQIIVLFAAIMIGYLVREKNIGFSIFKSFKMISKTPLYLFLAILIFVLLLAPFANPVALMRDFYLSGSYVFGGGHVVLPILQDTVGKEISHESFLLGYSVAQAVPGPMFTIGTYLGAITWPGNPFVGAIIGTIFIFLPGFLLILAFHKSWKRVISIPSIASISHCLNASVVGLLLAALYNPVFINAIYSGRDLALAILGLVLLKIFNFHIFYLVAGYAAIGYFL